MLERRRRQLQKKGRKILLSHQNQEFFEVLAYAPPPSASTLSEGASKQKIIFQILHEEIAQQNNFGRPRKGDFLKDASRTYTLLDASAVFNKNSITGWTLIADGGE